MILPVWAAGEKHKEIDFQQKFQKYQLTLADTLQREGNTITLIKDTHKLKTLKDGLIISFGAGDITYQIRGVC